jgi:hypothetical protein
MKVMPSNNRGFVAGWLAGRFPDRIAHLFSVGGLSSIYDQVTFSLDNGRFPAWSTGKNWDEDAYIGMLDRVAELGKRPEWILVPDIVTKADETLREWDRWCTRLQRYGWPLAFACQDGHTPEDIPAEASVAFLGGTTEWKRKHIRDFCDAYPRVHVGRINTGKWLWECDEAGAESCDGTGWFRGDQAQLAQLVSYLERSSAGLGNNRGEQLFA